MGMILLLLAINLGVSWLNCASVGRVWNESKALGGWMRLLAWCGAIQAAIGFSSVIGAFIGFALYGAGWLPPKAMQGALSLWYLLIIVPALSTGLIIMLESWIVAFRDRSLMNMTGAAYNTFAMAHNAYGAVDGISRALAGVDKLFTGDIEEDGGSVLMIAVGLVVVSIASGAILAAILIRRHAGTIDLPIDPHGVFGAPAGQR